MKQRRLYYRKKAGKIVIEGTVAGRTVLIWTVSDPEALLKGLFGNPSFFSPEKKAKIEAKLTRLDYKTPRGNKGKPKVHPIIIKRTQEKDGQEEKLQGETSENSNSDLWDLTK